MWRIIFTVMSKLEDFSKSRLAVIYADKVVRETFFFSSIFMALNSL